MMERALIGFGTLAAVDRFAFTGGDPFLFFGDIVAALQTARSAGVAQPFQIVTSAYWATSRERVVSILEELRALGLDLIGLSYDREHARWVRPDQILLVCDVAATLGIRVNLTGVFWDDHDSIEGLLPGITTHPARVHVLNLPVAPIGEARKKPPPASAAARPIAEKLSCGSPGAYSLAIYPDGQVYPCCSGGFQIEGRLSCGSLDTDSPERILFAARTNFHVRLVKEFGWGLLYEIVAREAPGLLRELPSLEKASGVCEVCRDLNLSLASKLAPIYEPIEIEYARTRAEFDWHALIGTDAANDRLWVGDSLMSWFELRDRLTNDRAMRLDYLAGVRQLTRAPISADAHQRPT
jgi:hypothetical protein